MIWSSVNSSIQKSTVRNWAPGPIHMLSLEHRAPIFSQRNSTKNCKKKYSTFIRLKLPKVHRGGCQGLAQFRAGNRCSSNKTSEIHATCLRDLVGAAYVVPRHGLSPCLGLNPAKSETYYTFPKIGRPIS